MIRGIIDGTKCAVCFFGKKINTSPAICLQDSDCVFAYKASKSLCRYPIQVSAEAFHIHLRFNHRTNHPTLHPRPHTNPGYLPRGLRGYHTHPAVILLDEATASLDVENETAVQAALSEVIVYWLISHFAQYSLSPVSVLPIAVTGEPRKGIRPLPL